MLNGPHGPYHWIGMDFAPYWVGVQNMLHGVSPYSPETLVKIQNTIYGGPALGNDPMVFAYPAWMFILILPFSLMPFKWAVIFYVGTLLWGMINLIFKLASILGKGNRLAQSFWAVWITLGSLPFITISVTRGQLGYLSLLALFFAYRVLNKKPELAGLLIGFALIKPTVTVAPVIGFLLWSLLQRNWRFFLGFISCMSILLATSFLAVGNWIPGYLDILRTTGGMPVFWSMKILSTPWNILFLLVFIGICLGSFILLLKKEKRNYWFSAMILVGIALTPMRWIYDLFLSILLLAEERNLSRLQSIIAGLAVISPWILFFIPETIRWNVAVIGVPLIWAVYLLVSIVCERIQFRKLDI